MAKNLQRCSVIHANLYLCCCLYSYFTNVFLPNSSFNVDSKSPFYFLYIYYKTKKKRSVEKQQLDNAFCEIKIEEQTKTPFERKKTKLKTFLRVDKLDETRLSGACQGSP